MKLQPTLIFISSGWKNVAFSIHRARPLFSLEIFLEKLSFGLPVRHHTMTVLNHAHSVKLPDDTDIVFTASTTLKQMHRFLPSFTYETRMIVLDDIDMLFSGALKKTYLEDTIKLIKSLPKTVPPDAPVGKGTKRQLLLMSPYLPCGTLSARNLLLNRFHLSLVHSPKAHRPPSSIEHHWIHLKDKESMEEKCRALVNLLRDESLSGQVLVFANARNTLEVAHEALKTMISSSQQLMQRVQVSLHCYFLSI
jgi:hypothetical protein